MENKSPAIVAFLAGIVGKDPIKSIEDQVCVACDHKIDGFRNEESRKEFQISGFCQKCQDLTFK